jgi:trimeric autotransporter adhesin
MKVHYSLGLLWVALFYAAPAVANPVSTLKPSPVVSSTTATAGGELLYNHSIQRLSQVEIAPRTLAESGISGAAIVPLPVAQAAELPSAELPSMELPSAEKVSPPQPTFRVAPQVGARFTSQGSGTDAFVGIEGFVPLAQTPGQSLTYLEGRLQISTENGALGSNALIGHRFLSESKRSIVGGYLSYDRRNTGDASFNQLGAGFESLSETFDARANVYLPFGKSSRAIGDSQIGRLSFRANELNIERLQAIQEALPGFDVEIGTKLFKLGKGSVRGYIGGYYYGGDQGGFAGFRSRLVARPTNTLTAGLTLQTDSRFDTKLIFSLGMQFPGSSASRSGAPTPSILARLGESPERQASILVDNYVRRDVEAAIDPATGQPWQFQFVNLGIGTGDGTFEAPAGTVVRVLPTARSGGIVYVSAGSNPGIPGFTIPDGVSVISDAPRITIPTQFGVLPLPNSGTGILPRITGTVTLGSNTTFAGFHVSNSPGVGVFGQNIGNVRIANNRITNSGAEGIRLNTTTGTVTITDNQIDGTAPNSSPDQSPGIAILNNTGATTIAIAQNTVSNTSGTGIGVNASGSAEITATIDQNQVAQSGLNGILGLTQGNGKLTVQVSNNQVTGNGSSLGSGIAVGSRDSGTTTSTVDGNRVTGLTNPNAGGIQVFAEGNSQTAATVSKNTVTGNYQGIVVSAVDTSRVQATVNDNIATGNIAEGILITGGINGNVGGVGSPQVAAIVTNNRVTGNNVANGGFNDVLIGSVAPGARVCLQLANNQIGVLTLADTAVPGLGAPFNTPPLSQLAGLVSVELPITLTNPGTNTIATVSPVTSLIWSRTNIPAGSCRLP